MVVWQVLHMNNSPSLPTFGLQESPWGSRNTSSSENVRTTATNAILVAVFVLIAIISVLGNLMVILAVCLNYRLQTASNYILASLAVADFFQGAISIPMRIDELLNSHGDLRSLCRAAIPVSIFFGGTSNLHILLVALERFIAICFPYLYVSCIHANVVFWLLWSPWVAVGLFALLPTMGWGRVEQTARVDFCRFPAFLTEDYITALYVFVHFIPVLTVAMLYTFILKASLKQARLINVQRMSVAFNNSHGYPPNTDALGLPACREERIAIAEKLKQRKAAKIVAYVVGLFILMVAPIIVIDVVEMLGGPSAPAGLVKLTVCMIYVNHCVNVFVYAGCNSDYRQAFKRIILKCVRFIVRAKPNTVGNMD